MKNLKTIYNRLPYFLQKLGFLYLSRRDAKKRFNPLFYKYFDALKKSWCFSPEEIKRLQEEQLIRLLLEAYHYSVWYQKSFKKQLISDTDIIATPFEVLQKLPFLEKQHIKDDLEEIVSRNPETKGNGINYTSGSTGTPMKTYMSDDSIALSFALWKRFHHTIGLPLHPRSIRFSGNQIIPLQRKKPPFWHYNPYEKRLFFSLYHLSPDHLPAYMDKLESFRPQLLDGYPSGIYALANYIVNNKVNLGFKPDAICTTAEPLTPLIRERIEEAFGCKVYNQYSCSEGGIFIAECTEGKLHVHLDSGVVEYLNAEGRPGAPGEVCELVISGFRNLKTPLIRYKTGDWVRLAAEDETCTCGSHMPLVDELFGREEDYLLDENGMEQGMVSYRTFKMASHILKAQIVQTSPSAVLVKIVRDKDYNEKDEAYVVNKLKEILGSSVEINVVYCQNLETGANGKLKTVIRAFK